MPRFDRAKRLPELPTRTVRSVLATGLLMGLLLPAPAADAQDGAASASGQSPSAEESASRDSVPDLVRELHTLRSEHEALKRRQQEEQSQLDEEINRLRDELALLSVQSEARSSLLARNTRRVASAQVFMGRIDVFMDDLIEDAQTTCRQVGAAIDTGISFLKVDRTKRLGAISEELSPRAGFTAGEKARGLVELMDFLVEELRLAETIEERSDLLRLSDDRRIHAFVVRLGLFTEAFVSEDGSLVGLSAGAGTWRTDLNDRERSAVQDLVATARGRRAAQLVLIPIGEDQH